MPFKFALSFIEHLYTQCYTEYMYSVLHRSRNVWRGQCSYLPSVCVLVLLAGIETNGTRFFSTTGTGIGIGGTETDWGKQQILGKNNKNIK